MKVCVHGLWHLGSVTAACLAAEGIDVVGLDDDANVVERLAAGIPPLHEPGLSDLVRAGLDSGRLRFSSDPAVCRDADVVWVTFDVPVDDEDRSDVAFVTKRVEATFPHLADGAIVLVSAQLPVGTTRALARAFEERAGGRRVSFACSPENLRLGGAIEAFRRPERIVLGVGDERARRVLHELLGRFCARIQTVSIESAEMTKHALNAWLAISVTFANEIASLCERVGADAAEVEQALRSEPRVGSRACIRPGAAFAGGTLARDVSTLERLAARHEVRIPLLSAVLPSNDAHRGWALRRLRAVLGSLAGRRIAVLGLAYKPGTDALRRSVAIELCRGLLAEAADVRAFDPVVRRLPEIDGRTIAVSACADDALVDADAAVLATEWPEFRDLDADSFRSRMKRALVIDAGGFLSALRDAPGIEHLVVGRPS